MILYHVTRKKFLPAIREQGLIPHVPGVVWDDGHPEVAKMTDGKPVVWLTADATEWRHDASATGDTEARLLTVRLEPNSKRLVHYATWLHDHDPDFYLHMQIRYKEICEGRYSETPQNIEAWHIYFGTIRADRIIDGLVERVTEAA
jgi:hypothetical protein